MDNILLNIDSKFRDIIVYPQETKFKYITEIPFKNITSVKLSTIEIINNIKFLDSSKQNNFFTLYFPSKNQDPKGITIVLDDAIWLLPSNIISFLNTYVKTINRIQSFETIVGKEENYFYFFYLNESSNIIFNFGTFILNAGWYSVYGMVLLISNFITTKKVTNFSLNTIILKVWDRRFRSTNMALNNIRFDIINSNNFNTNVLNNNLENFKTHIYGFYLQNLSNYTITLNGTGLLDKLVSNTFIIPSNYFKSGSPLTSSSKYYTQNTRTVSDSETIQLYNLEFKLELITMKTVINSSFNETTCEDTLYYYYVTDAVQTWEPFDDNGDIITNTINTLTDFSNKDVPPFEITFEIPKPPMVKYWYPSLGYYLGFRKLQQTPIFDISEYVIKSEKSFSLLGDNYFFIKINDWGHIDHLNKKYLAKIINTANLGAPIISDILGCDFYFKQPVNINRLDIEIVDYLGNTLDLQGVDYSFTLELKQIINSDLKITLERDYLNNYKI